MAGDTGGNGRHVVAPLRPTGPDPRVSAVRDVLAGRPVGEVAARWSVDTAMLERWVDSFVEAGTAQVTNTPDEAVARQRDRFLAAFAHEIRSPLTVAQGWVAMLVDGDVPPTAVARTVARLHDALAQLSERTRDVELLAAASLGRLQPDLRPVRVADVAEGTVAADQVGGDGAGPELVGDLDLLRRAVRDVWRAAAGSAPPPRAVRLESRVVGPWTELRVVREGDPIDPVVLQALFDPFDLNDDGTGVTIGLYLARALAVAHGGSVGVEQTDDRAVLWIRVPGAHGPATPPPRHEEHP